MDAERIRKAIAATIGSMDRLAAIGADHGRLNVSGGVIARGRPLGGSGVQPRCAIAREAQ